MGDFNLDVNMCNHMDYGRRAPLKLLTDSALANGLNQIVDLNTWTRNINDSRCQFYYMESIRKVAGW